MALGGWILEVLVEEEGTCMLLTCIKGGRAMAHSVVCGSYRLGRIEE